MTSSSPHQFQFRRFPSPAGLPLGRFLPRASGHLPGRAFTAAPGLSIRHSTACQGDLVGNSQARQRCVQADADVPHNHLSALSQLVLTCCINDCQQVRTNNWESRTKRSRVN